ncbi:MAG: organic hydroperoxide resistance protein [Moraxellaceae bacterium]|nr:organic hydroperoxide resistance protein [Pseudobdellovibrionaceae bacterium]
MKLDKVLYTAEATSTGGREGKTTSSDKSFDLNLTTPKGLGGNGAAGANPEQLFAAGYSACFIGAMKVAAGQTNVTLPNDLAVNAKVGIGPIAVGYSVSVDMTISGSGIEKSVLEAVVEKAHDICPYSNATRGNIDVTFKVI